MEYDATDIPAAYDRGRDHGPEVVDLWMNAISSHVELDVSLPFSTWDAGRGAFLKPWPCDLMPTFLALIPHTRC